MVRLSRLLKLAFFCTVGMIVIGSDSFAQSDSGVFRTPVRSTLQAIRPKNWRIFHSSKPEAIPVHRSPGQSAQENLAVCNSASQCAQLQTLPIVETLPTPTPTQFSVASMASSEIQSATEKGVVGDKAKFREGVLKANRQAYKSNEITLVECLRFARAAHNPAKLDEMMNVSREAAIAEGLATATAIDWDKLFAFLEKLLPLLIQLFG